jgi:hypothetical protein
LKPVDTEAPRECWAARIKKVSGATSRGSWRGDESGPASELTATDSPGYRGGFHEVGGLLARREPSESEARCSVRAFDISLSLWDDRHIVSLSATVAPLSSRYLLQPAGTTDEQRSLQVRYYSFGRVRDWNWPALRTGLLVVYAAWLLRFWWRGLRIGPGCDYGRPSRPVTQPQRPHQES